MTLGDGENPIILAAVYQEEASLYAVEQIMGELLAHGHAGSSISEAFRFSEYP